MGLRAGAAPLSKSGWSARPWAGSGSWTSVRSSPPGLESDETGFRHPPLRRGVAAGEKQPRETRTLHGAHRGGPKAVLRESRADPSWGWWVGKKKASWRPLAASSEDMAGTAAATGRVVVVLTILWDRCGPPSPIHGIAFLVLHAATRMATHVI